MELPVGTLHSFCPLIQDPISLWKTHYQNAYPSEKSVPIPSSRSESTNGKLRPNENPMDHRSLTRVLTPIPASTPNVETRVSLPGEKGGSTKRFPYFEFNRP